MFYGRTSNSVLNPVDTSQPVYEIDSDSSMDTDGSTSEPVSVGGKVDVCMRICGSHRYKTNILPFLIAINSPHAMY